MPSLFLQLILRGSRSESVNEAKQCPALSAFLPACCRAGVCSTQLQESSSKCWKGPLWVSASCLHLRSKKWFSFVPGAIARKLSREKESVPYWSEKQGVLLLVPLSSSLGCLCLYKLTHDLDLCAFLWPDPASVVPPHTILLNANPEGENDSSGESCALFDFLFILIRNSLYIHIFLPSTA